MEITPWGHFLPAREVREGPGNFYSIEKLFHFSLHSGERVKTCAVFLLTGVGAQTQVWAGPGESELSDQGR